MSFKYFNVKNGLTTGNITLHSSNANIQANHFLGNINVTSLANLGAVGNVKITGGTSTYLLSTDGTGNLSWVPPGGGISNITNGNSNITITANGNINMAVAGNANLLRLSGNGFYSNSTIVQLKSPLINQGGNPNGAPLSSNDGKDRGSLLNYYSTFPATAFMGWDSSNAEFTLASEVTVTDDVVTVFQLGNVRAGYIFGNVIGNISGNITAPGSNTQVIFNDEGNIKGASGLTFDKTNNTVSVANTFTAYGTIIGANLTTAGNLAVTGNGVMGTVTSYGIINAVGTVTGGNFYSGGSIQTVGTGTFGDIATGGNIAATGNIGGGNLITSGNLSVTGNATIGGNLFFLTANYANFSGNVAVGTLGTGILLRPNGYASVRGLEVYSTGPSDGNITSRLITTTLANVTTLNVSGTSNVQIVNAANVNAANGNFSGNITSLNANLGNLVSANFFTGDGYLLTNLTIAAGSAIVNGNSNVQIAPNANVTISANGISNTVIVTGTNTIFDSNVTINNNVIVSGSVYSNVIREGVASITLDGGAGTWIAFETDGIGNSFVIHGTGVNVFGYANITGSSTIGANLSVSSNLSVSGSTTVANISASNISGSRANITGNVTAGNVAGGNLVSANFISGDGYLLSNLTISAGSSIINGNSNVNVAFDANVTITAEGNANVVTVTGNSVVLNKQLLGTNANFTVANITTLNSTTLTVQNALNVNAAITANGAITGETLLIRKVAGLLGTAVIQGNLSAQDDLFVSGTSNVQRINASSIQVSGSINANTNISADDTVSANAVTSSISMSTGGNFTVSGNSSVQKLTAANVIVNGPLSVSGNSTLGNIDAGNLVSANFFSGDGYLISNLTIAAGTSLVNGNSNVIVITDGNVTTSVGGTANVLVVASTGANITGNIRTTGNANVGNIGAGRAVFTGNVSGTNISASGNITGGGTLIVSGTANTGAINSTGDISATGNITSLNATLGNLVTANFFSGDGYLLTNLTIPAGTALVNGNSNVLVTYSSDVNITAGGVANVLKVANTGATIIGSLGVTGNINGLRFSNGNSNISITENGPVVISAAGNNQIVQVTGIGANVYGTFRTIGDTVLSGNANINNIGVSGLVDVAGNITGGNLNSGGKLTLGGNANVANLGTTGFITATGNITGGNLFAGNANITSTANLGIGSTSYLQVLGGITSPVIRPTGDPAAGLIFSTTGTGNYVFNSGSSATQGSSTGLAITGYGQNYLDVRGGGSLQPVTLVASGTDTNINIALTPAGTGNVTTAANVVATGNGTFGNISTGGELGVTGNAVITGNLTVSGNFEYTNVNNLYIKDPLIELGGGANGAPLTTNDGMDRGTLLHYFTTTPVDAFMGWDTGNGEFAFGSNVSVTNNVITYNQLGNVRADVFIGNVTGNVSGIITAPGSNTQIIYNDNGTMNAASGATFNKSTNAFSVTGNLTGANLVTGGVLSATGNANVGNLGTAGLIIATGNITGGNLLGPLANGNSNVSIATANGNINFTAVGNTTMVITGTGANIAGYANITGNITGGNLLGPLANGNSNVRIATANGNISLTAVGNTTMLVTGTGANIAGYANITGNANIGNIGTAGLITATGNITGANLVTGGVLSATGNANVGNLGTAGVFATTLSATGNANVGNLGTAGLIIATGNITGGNLIGPLANGNSNVNIPSANGNINFTAVGNTTLVVTGTGANIAGTLSATGNITGANLIGPLANGNSNVSIATANGNISLTAVGNTTMLVTGTGANITGTLSVSGVSNLGNVGNVKITGGTSGYVLRTDGTGNLSWVAQSGGGGGGSANITVDNFTGNGVQTAFTLSVTPSDINETSVNYNGIVQLRNTYSLVGAVLTFTEAPSDGSLIEITTTSLSGGSGSANIAIYDEGSLLTSTVESINFAGDGVAATAVGNAVTVTISGGGGGGGGSTAITLDSFTGNGVQTAFTLSVSPASENYTFVNIDGVDQLKTAYSVSGTTLTFSSAPANGASIEVTIVAALSNAQPNFTTRTYTGNGVQNTFTVTSGVTSTGILVTENGILQTPDTDYTVSGANITFTTAPANLQAIQIRELGTVVAANTASAARALGYSLIFGG